jgi:hypothetical protein
MVTHSSTSRPVQCLCMAERTGCPVLTDLWSYVLVDLDGSIMSLVVASGALLERKRGAVGLGSRRTKDLGSSSQKSPGHCSTQDCSLQLFEGTASKQCAKGVGEMKTLKSMAS